MFKSRSVAKVKPSNSFSTVLILGIGNGFLTRRLFTSLKSLMKSIVLSFLSVMKEVMPILMWAETPKLPGHIAYSIL